MRNLAVLVKGIILGAVAGFAIIAFGYLAILGELNEAQDDLYRPPVALVIAFSILIFCIAIGAGFIAYLNSRRTRSDRAASLIFVPAFYYGAGFGQNLMRMDDHVHSLGPHLVESVRWGVDLLVTPRDWTLLWIMPITAVTALACIVLVNQHQRSQDQQFGIAHSR